MALNAPYTPNTVIQSTQVSNDLVGLANGSNDTTNNSMSTYRSELVLDSVASGCVWSGDSYGATKNASMTSGVVYIAGVRLPVTAVTGRLFTASKDTYIDVNGSGVPVYTETTNNAASAALTAGSIRIGIIITGATNIAAATSVNQGQETMVLPIASSTAYSVTDSLGNLICCRDPNHITLGYRQAIANQGTASTSRVQATSLSAPFILPTARKVYIKAYIPQITSDSGAENPYLSLWDGTVGSGTQLQEGTITLTGSAFAGQLIAEYEGTLAAGLHTINAGIKVSASSATYIMSSTAPGFLSVKIA